MNSTILQTVLITIIHAVIQNTWKIHPLVIPVIAVAKRALAHLNMIVCRVLRQAYWSMVNVNLLVQTIMLPKMEPVNFVQIIYQIVWNVATQVAAQNVNLLIFYTKICVLAAVRSWTMGLSSILNSMVHVLLAHLIVQCVVKDNVFHVQFLITCLKILVLQNVPPQHTNQDPNVLSVHPLVSLACRILNACLVIQLRFCTITNVDHHVQLKLMNIMGNVLIVVLPSALNVSTIQHQWSRFV